MEIRYKKIKIRNAELTDAQQLCTWWNDGLVMAHAGYPNGIHTTHAEVETLLNKNDDQHRTLMIEYEHRCIGEMVYLMRSNDVAEIGIKMCEQNYQNRGLGKIILSLLIHSLFHEMHCKKIILDTNLKNVRAQHVYETLGFQKIRIRTDAWCDQLGVSQTAVDYELVPCDFISFCN